MQVEEFGLSNNYNQLSVRYDSSHEVLWTYFNQQGVIPCWNSELIAEMTRHQQEIENTNGVLLSNNKVHQIRYSVVASLTPNVFNLGGHLALIVELAKNRNKEALLTYATKGIEGLLIRLNRFNDAPIINISLIQGLALGGGLEAALGSDIIVAERKSMFAFPEIHFNMFPGMGGYSLVSRKAGFKVADEMILKGKQYTAEEAYALGLVDILAEDGEGEAAVYDWIRHNKRSANGFLAAHKAKNRVSPITREELMDITKMWVDVALKLSEREFSIMSHFIYSQEKQYLKVHAPVSEATDNIVPLKRTAT